MRILLSADAEIPVPPVHYGGIERVIDSLVTEFINAGHTVGLLAHRDSTTAASYQKSWPGLTSTGPLDSIKNMGTLACVANQFRPDIFHSFSRLQWLCPLKISRGNYPLIMSYQREPTGRTVALANRLFDKRLHFTACSQQLAQKGFSRGGGSWTAIPNFVDLGKLVYNGVVSEDAPLVFLSRIEAIKGAHNAIAIAKGSGRRLLIAGNRVDSSDGKRYWREQIETEIGRNRIEYVGPVNDEQKSQLLREAAAMVVPIEWDEPFGIVFAEALACGTPVISTPRGAVPEIVNHGEHGFHINSNEEGIAAVAQLTAISRKACHDRVVERFSSSTVAKQYIELYTNLAS